MQYRWAASNITYNPLYFQDVSLERYGHNHGVFQPVVSVAKFGTQVIGLPYQMALDPPCSCETPLGYYRPGDCAPKLHYQIPLNARAALVQAAAVSGVALILPWVNSPGSPPTRFRDPDAAKRPGCVVSGG